MSTQIAPATIADLECHPGRCELIDGEIIEALLSQSLVVSHWTTDREVPTSIPSGHTFFKISLHVITGADIQ